MQWATLLHFSVLNRPESRAWRYEVMHHGAVESQIALHHPGTSRVMRAMTPHQSSVTILKKTRPQL